MKSEDEVDRKTVLSSRLSPESQDKRAIPDRQSLFSVIQIRHPLLLSPTLDPGLGVQAVHDRFSGTLPLLLAVVGRGVRRLPLPVSGLMDASVK